MTKSNHTEKALYSFEGLLAAVGCDSLLRTDISVEMSSNVKRVLIRWMEEEGSYPL